MIPPSTKVVFLTGPQRYFTPHKEECPSWFDMVSVETANLEEFQNATVIEDVNESQNIITKVMDQEIEQLGGDSTKLFLTGFSQGCFMSFQSGLSYLKELGGIMCFFGGLLPMTKISPANQHIHIFYTQGLDDDQIPVSIGRETCQKLREAGEQLEGIICRRIKHRVNEVSAQAFNNFFQKLINEQELMSNI